MDVSNPFYVEVLKTLSRSNVQYLLVGGLAVAYHGYSRYTGDMDLWVQPNEANMSHLYEALLHLGYSSKEIDYIKESRSIDHPTPIKLQDDKNRLKIDLMTNIYQRKLSWEECSEHAETMQLDTVKVPVVDIDRLIFLKENSSRLSSSMKDLVDAQELRKIKAQQTPQSDTSAKDRTQRFFQTLKQWFFRRS